jgi:hypothetical protein
MAHCSHRYFVNEISERLIPQLHRDLDIPLYHNITTTLSRDLPELLRRTLRVTLTDSLTWALTHALVPTLTLSLAKASDQHCLACRTTGSFCSQCHTSPQGMYYSIYHATYYADYYSNYYKHYYQEAGIALNVEAAKKLDKPAESEARKLVWEDLSKELETAIKEIQPKE